MPKKSRSDLLGPLPSSYDEPFSLTNGASNKEIRRIQEEAQKQTQVMRYQKIKTVIGIDYVAEMHQRGADQYYDTMVHHEAVNECAQGMAFQPFITAYLERDAHESARHFNGLVDVGARIQAGLIAESCLPAPEPRGFWRRLLGGS